MAVLLLDKGVIALVDIGSMKISEIIMPEVYQNWADENEMVFYAAGTGKGKTHMIISEMAKNMPEKQFLYLVNRKKLDDHIHKRIDSHNVGNVTPRTYQQVENIFQQDNIKHIYFIAETKGSLDSLKLNHITPIEQAKIDCARKHFAAISSSSVKYDVVDSYQALLDIVMK